MIGGLLFDSHKKVIGFRDGEAVRKDVRIKLNQNFSLFICLVTDKTDSNINRTKTLANPNTYAG